MEASPRRTYTAASSCLPACLMLVCALSLAGCGASRNNLANRNPGGLQSIQSALSFQKKAREVIDPEGGMDEYDAAVVKFEAKQYDDAAKEFKAIAKKWYDYPVEEDAMFMLAECRYASKRYAWAQDAYDGLLKKYPSSRYLEKSTRRLYSIGAIWLNGDENTDTSELVQVSATDVQNPSMVQRKPIPHRFPLAPNFFDTSRPMFDTPGNALKALKSVWLYDPTGPLADDALMLSAVHNIRKGDLRDADYFLDTLRQNYPKSEHTQTAFVVGSHIKLASYQGALYDGRDLVDADDLIHSTLNLYPDIEEREALKNELTRIHDLGAERAWAKAQYYRKKDKPQSEAIYCETVLKEFAKSKYAVPAAKRLQELGPKYWTGLLDSYPGERSLEAPEPTRKSPRTLVPPRRTAPDTGRTAPRTTPRTAPRTGPALEPNSPETEEPRRLPSDSNDENYEPLPPARQSVDEPGIVDDSSEWDVQPTDFEDTSGRARP